MKTLFLAAALALAIVPAEAHEFKLGALPIDHPMIQEAPPSAPVLAGYVTITNSGVEDDRLIGIESPAARSVQLHSSVVTDGVARMSPMTDGLSVPAGATIWLGENGTHAMFTGPDRRYVDGDKIPATLLFEKAGRIEVMFNVEKVNKSDMGPGHAGMDMGGADAGQ